MSSIFCIDAPSSEDLVDFHRDGYVAFPEVFTEAGLAGLIDEILHFNSVWLAILQPLLRLTGLLDCFVPSHEPLIRFGLISTLIPKSARQSSQ